MTEITQADCDVAETLFNDVLGNVSSYGEWGYMSYRQAAERSMAEAFARHREQAAAEERAKIVKWLRGFATNKTDELADILETHWPFDKEK